MTTTARPYTAGLAAPDGETFVQAQWPTDIYWNGFLCPSIDPLAVVTVLDKMPAEGTDAWEYGYSYSWREDGALVVTDHTYANEDGYTPDVIEPDEDGLYSLGAFAWCWSAPWPADEDDEDSMGPDWERSLLDLEMEQG